MVRCSVAELLLDLGRLGIRLKAHGDRLRYAPADRVTPELIERLRAHKPELLVMLRPADDGTDYLADEVELDPCPKCGSLQQWQDCGLNRRWRCMACDPPTTALRILSLARRCRAQRATLAPDERRAEASTVASTAASARQNASGATAPTNAVRQWRNHDNANRATVRNNSY